MKEKISKYFDRLRRKIENNEKFDPDTIEEIIQTIRNAKQISVNSSMQNAYARFIGTIKESIAMMAMEDVGRNKGRITQYLKIVWKGVYGGKDKKLFLQFVNEIYTTIDKMANLHAGNLVKHPREIRTAKIKEELFKIADEISAQ